jgi:hypothetical protein
MQHYDRAGNHAGFSLSALSALIRVHLRRSNPNSKEHIMATALQIAANRRNAKKSTGPRTRT